MVVRFYQELKKKRVQLKRSSFNLNVHDNVSLTGREAGIFTWEISKRWVDIFVKFCWNTQKPRMEIGKKQINILLLNNLVSRARVSFGQHQDTKRGSVLVLTKRHVGSGNEVDF